MNKNVSVVIPYYHAVETIARALNSVQQQTLPVSQVIIVNDGSDLAALNTAIFPFQHVLPLKLIDLGKNCGAAYARNIGVAAAESDFIAFLDADDVWHKDKIRIQYDFMQASGAFLSCHGYVYNLNNDEMRGGSANLAVRLRSSDFIWRNHIHTPTVMVARKHFVDFDQRLTRSEDLKCWISNFENGEFYRLPATLAGGYKKAVGESGLSGSYSLMHTEYLRAWRMLRAEKKVSLLTFLLATAIEQAKYPIRLMRS